MEREPDFLDELITERSSKNPEFPRLVQQAEERCRQAKVEPYRELADDEERLGIIKHSSRQR
jgi:hypothetical protein